MAAAAERLPPPIPHRLSRDGHPELLVRVLLEGRTEATGYLLDTAHADGWESADRIQDRAVGVVEDVGTLSGQRIPGWGNVSVEISWSQPLHAKHHGVLVCMDSQDLSEGDGAELSCLPLSRALARQGHRCETALAVVTDRTSVEPFVAKVDALRSSCTNHGLAFYVLSRCDCGAGVTPMMALRGLVMQVLDRNETDLGHDGRFRKRRGHEALRAEQLLAWGWATSGGTTSSAPPRPSIHARATNVHDSASSLPNDLIRMVAEALHSLSIPAPCFRRNGEGHAAASCRLANEAWQIECKRQAHQRPTAAPLEHYAEADELLLRRFLAKRLQEQCHHTSLCGTRRARALQPQGAT